MILDLQSVLVCMEADPECCHRNVLAHYLVGMMELPIQHLGSYNLDGLDGFSWSSCQVVGLF